MAVEISTLRKGIAKKDQLTPKDLAFAILIAFGWSPADAYIVLELGPTDITEDLLRQKAATKALEANVEKVAKRTAMQIERGATIDAKGHIHITPLKTPGKGRQSKEHNVPISDAEMRQQTWATIQALPVDDPQRAKLIDLLDKMQRRMGQTSGEDTTVHIYLPRPVCDGCPFVGTTIVNDPVAQPEQEEAPEGYNMNGKPYKTTLSVNGKKLGRRRKGEPKAEPKYDYSVDRIGLKALKAELEAQQKGTDTTETN